MSDNEFEPYKVPALGKAIARTFVTCGAALQSSWRAIFPQKDRTTDEKTDYTHWVTRYAWFLIPFWLFFSGAVFLTLLQLYYAPLPDDPVELQWRALALTALLTALGGLIAAPLTIIRVYVNERQAKTAEEGLITDRITKAIEQLGAEKTVKTTVDIERMINGEKITQQVVDERTEPNLEVRLGAIYALERIAEDSERDHIPIMETLCAYIRENSQVRVVRDFPEPEWKGLADYSDEAACEAHLEKRRERFGASIFERGKAMNWAQGLTAPRADIQAAISVLGRRSEDRLSYEAKQERPFQLDLRAANLQGADMSNLRLGPALMTGTRLQGVDFNRALMQGAALREAKMEGADLSLAKMERADLSLAKMEGAYLREAKMEGADLSGAEMERADLSGASLKSADLARCKFARMRARSADFTEAKAMTPDQVNALFGDTDTKLLDGLKRTTELNHAPLENSRQKDSEFERWKAAGCPEGEVLDDG